MKKSVFVMDTPKMCMDCPFAYPENWDLHICVVAIGEDGHYKIIDNASYAEKLEDWCPLRPLPEKMDVGNIDNIHNFNRAVGWNTCIDEIAGE